MPTVAYPFPNDQTTPGYGLRAVPGPLAHFRHCIETTDWDERYLRHKRIDRVCRGILIAAALYFIPVLATLFLR